MPHHDSQGAPVVRVLMLTQVFVPDEASVGLMLDDLSRTIVARGRAVHVLTSSRGYDEPRRRYPSIETRAGVSIQRVFTPSSRKRRIGSRLMAGMVFLAGACWRVLGAPRFDVLLVATSPPMAPLAGVLLARLRGARSVLWLTDIMPDEAIAAGVLSRTSLVARLASWWTRMALKHADVVITLDEQMRQRALADGARAERLQIIPPWSMLERAGGNATIRAFREAQGWNGARVIMYAGNHSPVHPLDTLIGAMQSRPANDVLRFAFVGGGSMKPRIDAIRAANVSTLPLQPRESLPTLLPAADVHVVSMGDAMHGIVHPSKFYGAIAAGRPILFLGSDASVLGAFVREHRIGWIVPHGDMAGMQRVLDEIAGMSREELGEIGARALATHRALLDPGVIRARFADVVLGGV